MPYERNAPFTVRSVYAAAWSIPPSLPMPTSQRWSPPWQRDLGAVRRLAPKTLEAYRRDLGQFLNFLGPPHRRRR